MPAVGGVVWIQCGERANGIVAGFERVCDDALGRSGGSHRLAGRGVAPYRSGAVAGLATVTQGAGFVCFYLVVIGKHRLGCDDTLDAFGVHGAGGIIGATLTGVVATRAVNDALKLAKGEAAPIGWVDGNGEQVGNQLMGAAIGIGFAVVGSWMALKMTAALRADCGWKLAKRSKVWT